MPGGRLHRQRRRLPGARGGRLHAGRRRRRGPHPLVGDLRRRRGDAVLRRAGGHLHGARLGRQRRERSGRERTDRRPQRFRAHPLAGPREPDEPGRQPVRRVRVRARSRRRAPEHPRGRHLVARGAQRSQQLVRLLLELGPGLRPRQRVLLLQRPLAGAAALVRQHLPVPHPELRPRVLPARRGRPRDVLHRRHVGQRLQRADLRQRSAQRVGHVGLRPRGDRGGGQQGTACSSTARAGARRTRGATGPACSAWSRR